MRRPQHRRLQAIGDVGTMQRPDLVQFSREAMRLRFEVQGVDDFNDAEEAGQQIAIDSATAHQFILTKTPGHCPGFLDWI